MPSSPPSSTPTTSPPRTPRTDPQLPAYASEALADHLFALGPKRLGVVGVERVGAYAAHLEVRRVHDRGDTAVLAKASANLIGGRDAGGPHRGRRALWNRLPLESARAAGPRGVDI